MKEIEMEYKKALGEGDLLTCIEIAHKSHGVGIDVTKLSDAVIKSKNPFYSIHYVKWLKPKDIKPFENIILESGDARIATIFAVEHKDKCDLDRIEKLILDKGDAYDCVDYVVGIDTKNHEAFKQKIIDEEEPYACYLYCLKFQPYGSKLKPFEDIVVENGDVNTVCLFASNIYDANILRLSAPVFKFGNVEDIINYSCLAGEKYSELYEYVYNECGFDGEDYLRCYKQMKKYLKLIMQFENSIVKYGTLDDIKDFMLVVPFANCTRLQEIIEKSDRKDLKLEIAMSDFTDLESLTKNLCEDGKRKLNTRLRAKTDKNTINKKEITKTIKESKSKIEDMQM